MTSAPFQLALISTALEINTTFTDKAGNPVKLLGVFPGNRLTLTNLETGEVNQPRPPTGSFQARGRARRFDRLLCYRQQALVPTRSSGEPGIWSQSGRVTASFDAEGNMMSVGSTGKLIDLCPRLAP